jgi:tRNA (cytidine/uridine-2'-O-)-methyltransferase
VVSRDDAGLWIGFNALRLGIKMHQSPPMVEMSRQIVARNSLPWPAPDVFSPVQPWWGGSNCVPGSANPMTDRETGLRVALYQPDIAQNTGTILRLCACFGLGADIIEPCGFPFSDARFRRAGMDYLDAVDLTRHTDFAEFKSKTRAEGRRMVLLTTKADTALMDFTFTPLDTLVLGRESAGAPESVHAACDARIRIPMASGMRSLNVAVSAAMVVGEALRQTDRFPKP